MNGVRDSGQWTYGRGCCADGKHIRSVHRCGARGGAAEQLISMCRFGRTRGAVGWKRFLFVMCGELLVLNTISTGSLQAYGKQVKSASWFLQSLVSFAFCVSRAACPALLKCVWMVIIADSLT